MAALDQVRGLILIEKSIVIFSASMRAKTENQLEQYAWSLTVTHLKPDVRWVFHLE